MLEGKVKDTTRSTILIARMAMTTCKSATHAPITHRKLVRNTQELMDSVAVGDPATVEETLC